jgi:lysophospholipase L1-like esterase
MEVVRELAAKHEAPLADIFGELQSQAAGGRDLAGRYLDHVHLNPAGNRVVAGLLLDFERKSGVFRTLSERKTRVNRP